MILTKDGPKRLVLVVEDDGPVREVLTDAIREEHGYAAVPARDADEALAALDAVEADVAILDVDLPGISGLELYDRIRDDPRYRDMPVIFETGHEKEHGAALRQRGVPMFVRKPFDISRVVDYVKAVAPPLASA